MIFPAVAWPSPTSTPTSNSVHPVGIGRTIRSMIQWHLVDRGEAARDGLRLEAGARVVGACRMSVADVRLLNGTGQASDSYHTDMTVSSLKLLSKCTHLLSQNFLPGAIFHGSRAKLCGFGTSDRGSLGCQR